MNCNGGVLKGIKKEKWKEEKEGAEGLPVFRLGQRKGSMMLNSELVKKDRLCLRRRQAERVRADQESKLSTIWCRGKGGKNRRR